MGNRYAWRELVVELRMSRRLGWWGAGYVYDGFQLEEANFTQLCGLSSDNSPNRVTPLRASLDKHRGGSY